MSIDEKTFGFLADETEIKSIILKNKTGAAAEIINFGAALRKLSAPDRNGSFDDVIIGFDTLDDYIKPSIYQGKTVGRYANRIADGHFTLNGKDYNLPKNENGITTLHGGEGFSSKVWKIENEDSGKTSVKLSLVSADGEDGFPGKTTVGVTYTLTDDNGLKIEYEAVSDRDTVINLTNHSYFNLGGKDCKNVLHHEMQIFADSITAVDKRFIPTGEIMKVRGTPMDFTKPKEIGKDIGADFEQLKLTGGYDHNYVLSDKFGKFMKAAEVTEKTSGRVMEVFTDMPGIQFYSGNMLDGETGKNGRKMVAHCGFCLETQYYPDTPNHPSFPSCVYKAGEKYSSTTEYKFSVK